MGCYIMVQYSATWHGTTRVAQHVVAFISQHSRKWRGVVRSGTKQSPAVMHRVYPRNRHRRDCPLPVSGVLTLEGMVQVRNSHSHECRSLPHFVRDLNSNRYLMHFIQKKAPVTGIIWTEEHWCKIMEALYSHSHSLYATFLEITPQRARW